MKVIITGMHRSGTSMVAGLLQLCGLYLGTNLLGKASSNARGHFEDREFLALNIRLLKANGGDWKNPPERIGMPNNEMRMKMEQFVAKWPKDKLVGWKDPRACLTLHLWKEIIRGQKDGLRIILCLRSFLEIADSLKERNNIDTQRGQMLSYFYMKKVKESLKNVEWIATSYRDYFNNWRSEFKELTDFLGLEIPKDKGVIENFIDKSLWHHRQI